MPFSRIQQVELRQQLLARILGVSLVQVETAGDAGAHRRVLRFLEHPQAEALRDHLLAQQRRVRGGTRGGSPTATSQATCGTPAPRRPQRALVRPAPRAAGGRGAVERRHRHRRGRRAAGHHGVTLDSLDVGRHDALRALGQWARQTVGLLVVIGLVVTAVTCLHSWDFELRPSATTCTCSYGLLDRRQHTIPRHRLQHVRVLDNPVRRSLGLVERPAPQRRHAGRGDSPAATSRSR